VCAALAQIAKHSVELAETVVEAEIFPKILSCLKDTDIQVTPPPPTVVCLELSPQRPLPRRAGIRLDPIQNCNTYQVRKNSATCIREIAKHTPELARLIVNSGGVTALVDYVNDTKGNARLPGMPLEPRPFPCPAARSLALWLTCEFAGIMTLGYISAFSETLAMGVIVAKGVAPLLDAFVREPEDHIKSAAAWSLGQIGRHSPDHAKALAVQNVFAKLLAVYLNDESSEDLKTKSKRTWPASHPHLHPHPNSRLAYRCAQERHCKVCHARRARAHAWRRPQEYFEVRAKYLDDERLAMCAVV
jgi:hypothetical protein